MYQGITGHRLGLAVFSVDNKGSLDPAQAQASVSSAQEGIDIDTDRDSNTTPVFSLLQISQIQISKFIFLK